MNGLTFKNTGNSRKAVSQIVGSLLMMAIVATVGTVILFQGLQGINTFNNVISGFLTDKQNTVTESLIIEHVRLQASGNPPVPDASDTCPCLKMWFRNTGTTDAKIVSIKMIRMDVQQRFLDQNNVNLQVPVKNLVFQKYSQATFTALGLTSTDFDLTKTYKISVTTEKGNSYSTIASTSNT